MFKFVVLSALVAVAMAAPGVLHGGHLAYSGHVGHVGTPVVHSAVAHHGLALPAVSTYSAHGLVNAHGIHGVHGVHSVAPIAVAHSLHGVHGVHGVHGIHHL